MSDHHAVFLSYASQDVEAAKRIADALRATGVEVWLDQSELVGGDAWDAKIRGQIASCALFLPVISGNTQSRLEGYFRLEWKLAAQRTHMISERTAFLLPVVIDATRDADADVPTEFRAVQWTKLPAGETSAAFVSRVQKLLGGPSASVATEAHGRTRPSAPIPVAKSGRLLWVTAALGALVLGGIAFIALRPTAKETPGAAPAKSMAETKPAPVVAPAPAQSVAVLAFANMSADRDAEYFSDGISEEILNALANNPALRVAGRTSSFSFKGKNATNEEIGRALNVARVIEGSVRKAGNKVRITVQLINAADGYHLWSEAFDRDMTDIFAVQSEIAAKVAQKLAGGSAAAAISAPVTAVPTKNLEAYDLYLRGRALQTAGQRATVDLEIINLYEEAVRLDPGYALAWARMAEVCVRLTTGGFDRSPQIATKAANAATTALRLAPQLPEAHLAIASVRLNIDRDHVGTQRALDELARLAPNNAEVYLARANLERVRGNWGESLVRFAARAAELDPQNAASLARLATLLGSIGRFAEADRLAVRSWELSQSGTLAIRRRALNNVAWTGDVARALELLSSASAELQSGPLALQTRARLHAMRGDVAAAVADLEQSKLRLVGTTTSGFRGGEVQASYLLSRFEASRGQAAPAAAHLEEALKLARRYVADFPDLQEGPAYLARIHATRGERAEALAAINDAMALTARTRDAFEIAGMRETKAEVLALLGDKAAAIAELRAVHDMGYAFGFTLRLEPEWAALRSEPAFQRLMAEAEAQAKAQPRPKK